MSFSSIPYLYFFLPAVLLLHGVTPRRYRNHVLLLFSLLFYFFGEPVYTALLLASSLSDYLHSLYIERRRGTPAAKRALISSILVNIAMLGFFKYADFIIGAVNALTGAGIPVLGIPLPLGISFFTFQTMSYTIDVYRGRVHAQRDMATFAAFVCLFPQLVAGPIVRYSDIEAQLENRRMSIPEAAAGIRRFICGLAKKVLIANTMGELCQAFRGSGEKTVLFYWMYAAAFTLQIYFDFSGYSDMAIGLGRMLGFSFPENFDYPYISRSVSEFWRRWHMTLGGWFRDYVYIPLGGNRVRKGKWLRNVLVVWMLTGLWHGADWNFILWGAMFGVLLILEKFWIEKFLRRAGRAVSHIYVMLAVIIGTVLFNGDGLSGAAADLAGLFGIGGVPLYGHEALYYLRSYAVPLILAIVGATPAMKWIAARFRSSCAPVMTVLEPVTAALSLLVVTAYLVNGSFNPFLYFRF